MFTVKDKEDLLQQSKNEGGDISSMFFTIPEKKRLSESLSAFQSKVKQVRKGKQRAQNGCETHSPQREMSNKDEQESEDEYLLLTTGRQDESKVQEREKQQKLF